MLVNNHNVHKRLYVHNEQLGYTEKMWLAHSMYVRESSLVYLHTLNITYTIYRPIYKSTHIYIYTYIIQYTILHSNMYIIIRLFIKYNACYTNKKHQHIAIHYYIILQLLHYSYNNIHYITQHKR